MVGNNQTNQSTSGLRNSRVDLEVKSLVTKDLRVAIKLKKLVQNILKTLDQAPYRRKGFDQFYIVQKFCITNLWFLEDA